MIESFKPITIFLKRIYVVKSETIFNLFKRGKIFELTGANDIKNDFEIGGAFSLTFNNRGIIYGQFQKITAQEIILEWNVEGFERPKETKTIVEISWRQDHEKCILKLDHKNIVEADSANAKRRAWKEILEDVEREMNIVE